MSLLGRTRKARAEKLGPTTDEEYDDLTGEERELRSQIRDLEGFIDEAPQIREERKQETQMTLPPPEGEISEPAATVLLDDEEGDEDLQGRYGRRHLAAMRRARRRNFYIFVISAAAVSAFLYWVSTVVQ